MRSPMSVIDLLAELYVVSKSLEHVLGPPLKLG